MKIDLEGKVAMVTGSARGIGREIALSLAAEGAITIVTDIQEAALGEMEQIFSDRGYTGKQFSCDVRESEQIRSTVDAVVKDYGRIDILVNNAGVVAGGPVDRMTEAEWDATLDVNLKGTFLMSRAVVPILKKQRSGRIINAASFAAIVPRIGTAAYAASKAGVVYFTRVLAGELGPWNVTVNCYAPGMIATDMARYDQLPDKDQARLLDTLTIRKWGREKDIANLICFLASDYAGYITGALIDVSGGKLATQLPSDSYEWELE
jgi:3-oxoacyl-[acyl-carrier protein] reductase